MTSLPQTYLQPWSDHLRLWPAGILLLLIPLTAVVVGIASGSANTVGAGILVLFVAYFPLSTIAVTALLSPAQITAIEEGLVVRNYVGRTRTFAWDEIAERRELEGPATVYGFGSRQGIWLVTKAGRVLIVDETLPGYWHLHEITCTKAPQARVTGDTRASWQRAFNIVR